jgi:hypothetical protein
MACGQKNQRQSHSIINYFILSRIHKKTRALSGLPSSRLRLPFPRKGWLVARMRGRCVEKASAGKEFHTEILSCFRRKRRARGRSTGSPLRGIIPRMWFWRCARPVQEVKDASWFFRATPSHPGRATIEIQKASRILAGKPGWDLPVPAQFGDRGGDSGLARKRLRGMVSEAIRAMHTRLKVSPSKSVTMP